MARKAKSLDALLKQANALAPKRSKASDGWLGDAAHRARKSDHNPNSRGVVQALDITHDPKGGLDSYKLAETLRQNRDPRIKYVISAGKIYSPDRSPWQWRRYTGANSHHQHVHVSVVDNPLLHDDPRPWNLGGGPLTGAPSKVTPPTLWRGAKGADVERVQFQLGIDIDGDFGPKTYAAVRAYQKKKGLTADGVVGMNTWLALLS